MSLATPPAPAPRFDHFYRYDELTRLLFDYAGAFPALLRIESIGKSHEGRDIWLAVLTNTATGADTDKPAFWCDRNIHAAELTASTACLYWLHRLVTRHADDANVEHLLDTRTVYICPRLNPDGAELALLSTPRHIPARARAPIPSTNRRWPDSTSRTSTATAAC